MKKIISNAKKIFEKQPTINKILLIMSILYLIIVTLGLFSLIGWWTVFTSIALSYILNMWTQIAKEIENKEFEEDNKNNESKEDDKNNESKEDDKNKSER